MSSHPHSSGVANEEIVLDSVCKSFGSTKAVDSVDLVIGEGEFFSLLGPSGCGKTTLLRVIAGFETPDSGRVVVNGKDVTSAPPQKRPTAMVFQNYALFPTMTVGENVAYGLRVRRVPKNERRRRVQEALARVGMDTFTDRPVSMLSGGQQQRVAVARALAVEPEVLLFDEPLSNLDVALRERTRTELRALQHRLGITSVYVTHDQEEALALSDRIGVMNQGRLLEVGTPSALYEDPSSAFVARFLGSANLFRDERAIKELTGLPPRADAILAVRPENLLVAHDGGLAVTIVDRQYLGSVVEYAAETVCGRIRIRTSPESPTADVTSVAARKWTWVTDDIKDGTADQTE